MAINIVKTWSLPFPLETVYDAWVSSSTVIPPATRMDVCPIVGGHYRLFMETPDFVGRNEGEFLLVEPNSRVRYTWEWNGDGEVTTIDVTFEGTEHGTDVRLSHDGFATQESADTHNSGWDSYIEGFTEHLRVR